jgi:hypothetical protein
MPDLTLPLLITLLTAAPFVAGYWIARAAARVKIGRRLRAARPWRTPELDAAVAAWLVPGYDPVRLPDSLSLAEVACEWAAADPEAIGDWRFARSARAEDTPLGERLRSLWDGLPAAARVRSEQYLREALGEQESAWSGAERGWTGFPYVVPSALGKRREPDMRAEIEKDLTSAPAPGPLRADRAAADAPGWMLPLLLALQRRAPVRRVHPLAAAASEIPGLANLSGRVGSDLGRRLGAGLGSVLGPIGATVGQYVGGMVGAAGGRSLAGRAKMTTSSGEIEEAERCLAALGEIVERPEFAVAAAMPEQRWLATGTEWERQRERRRTRFLERFWPSREQALGEECLRAAAAELRAYRQTAPAFAQAVERAAPLVRGGIVLQNPWLAAAIPGAPEAVSAARAALNRAARALSEGAGDRSDGT